MIIVTKLSLMNPATIKTCKAQENKGSLTKESPTQKLNVHEKI
ncbi:hypothetical protein NIES3585_04570 [Nodularia sp. NIES-3585]|nr:hypothetical protein NIES3585_04570 [Nodularia sp. NIES-3585]